MTAPAPYGPNRYHQPAPYGQPVPPAAGPYAMPGYNMPGTVQPLGSPGAWEDPGTGRSRRTKSTAAVLAFFLGWMGAHNFYRGQTGRGMMHLVLAAAPIVWMLVGFVLYYDRIFRHGNVDIEVFLNSNIFIEAVLIGAGIQVLNGLWAFIELILILASSDGSLQ